MIKPLKCQTHILFSLMLLFCAPVVTLAALDPAEEQALVKAVSERKDDKAFVLEAAKKFGQNNSMAGLNKFLDIRDYKAIDVFYKHYNKPHTPLPLDIQSIIISNFDDDFARTHLAQFVYKRPYDNPELFDLIHAQAHSKDKIFKTWHWYELVLISTAKDIEHKTLTLYKYLDQRARKAILEFMIKRKYEGAIPYFVRYHDEVKLGSKSLYVHSSLLKYQTAKAAEALGSLFTRYKVPKPGNLHLDLTTSALIHLEQFHESVPIDFSKFISDIPFKNYDKVITRFISLVNKRHPQVAVRFMRAYLHNKKHYKHAFKALESYVDLQAWQDTKVELGKAYNGKTFDTRYYQAAVAKLDQNIARYDQLVKAKESKKGPSKMDDQLALLKKKHKLGSMKNATPDAWLEAYDGYIDSLESFLKDNRKHGESRKIFLALIRAYKKVGNIHRFYKQDPQEALKWYDEIIEVNEKYDYTETYEALLMRAEVYQYDLKEKDKAIEVYIDALDEMRRSQELARYAALQKWLDKWLVKYVRFLKTGKAFKDSVNRRDVAAFSVALIFANRILDINGIQQSLSGDGKLSIWKIPKSHFLFSRYIMAARNKSPEKLLKYLNRVDQSGYWQKNYFSFISMAALPRENKLAQNVRKMGNSITIRKAKDAYRKRNP